MPGSSTTNDSCYNTEDDYICGTVTTVYVSPHVILHADDPQARYLQAAWQDAISRWVTVINTDDEAQRWRQICMHELQVCTGDLLQLFGISATADGLLGNEGALNPFATLGTLLLTGAIGPGQGYTRVSSLAAPQTLVGLTVGDAEGLAASDGLCNSFVGSTQVLMADGTSKPISKVKSGDKIANAVPGVDPGTKDQSHVVTAIHVTPDDKDFTDVTVDAGYATWTITGTTHHLYWDDTTHAWTPAGQLRAGDRLQTDDAHTVTIAALHTTTIPTGPYPVTYNLTIDTLHTYYVLAGTTPVLVHNTGCDWRVGDAGDIARGHAGSKHAGDFKGMTEADLEAHVRGVMENPSDIKSLRNGRTAYTDGETVVIHDPMHDDLGTVFRPAPEMFDTYWGILE